MFLSICPHVFWQIYGRKEKVMQETVTTGWADISSNEADKHGGDTRNRTVMHRMILKKRKFVQPLSIL